MAKGKKNKKKNNTKPQVKEAIAKVEAEVKNKASLPNSKKSTPSKAPKAKVPYRALLDKQNLKWIGIGAVVLLVGYLLMIGGKSEDPNVYDEKRLFSFVRISLAPILICIGFGLQMYGILLRTPKNTPEDYIEEKALDN